MLSRLTHAAVAFALTVVVYQGYVIFAVPFIEPGAANRQEQQELDLDQLRKTLKSPHKYRDLLAAYFPKGHWTLASPPKTFETERMMVVLDDYHPRDDGQVRVEKCVMIFFPHARVQGEGAPRDAIILEAPHGAVLQMDSPVQPGLSSMGRIQWGKLIGDIVIRSDMQEPGPADDLLVTTRDLNLNEDMIRTDDKAEMQLGPHWGRGRVLEIGLMAVERTRRSSSGTQLGGIDYLEIKHDVRAQLSPGKVSLLPENRQPASNQQAPPVKIASRGRFRFDFPNSMASFIDQVQVVQEHNTGLRDQLFCSELNLYFRTAEPRIQQSSADRQESTESDSETGQLTNLQPASIEAKGSAKAPVVLEAPSHQAAAECDRMHIELDARRVTFHAHDDVQLKYQGSEIHAPMIRYQAPPKGSPHVVGPLLAAGNGWIRAVMDDQESQPLEISWSESLQMDRVNGKPEISLRGRPKLDMLGVGTLWANHLRVVLRERKPDGSEDQLLPGPVVPERVIATGLVGIDSPELSGKDFHSLNVTVQYKGSGLQLGTPDGRDSEGRPMLANQDRQRKSRSYHVAGDQLRVYLSVSDGRPEVSYIGVEGQAVFRETSRENQQTEPLLVQADILSVKNADSPNAEIELTGRPAAVSASGMSIQAERFRLNRGSGDVRIDSPGQMELLLDRDLQGNRLQTPQPMTITWQQYMDLTDGRITFNGKVRALSGEGVLSTSRIVAVLSGPLQFDGAASRQRTEIAQLECWEGVHAQFQQRDQFGLTSTQVMQLESIIVNQRSGKISGQGPGELESVHLTKGGSPLKTVSASTSGARANAQRLGYLHVQFRKELLGNLHRRQVEVVGDASAVYGPVDSWEQKLAIALGGTPGPGELWITSDRIAVSESPQARQQRLEAADAFELEARGNVTIEGPYRERGTFTIRSDRADYDQVKSKLVLEGDGQRPAELHLQDYPGAVPSTTKYRKFDYNLKTEEFNVIDFSGGEWIQLDLGK